MENITNRYKNILYKNYGRDFQDASEIFDVTSAERWARAYRWYLRGWLPEKKTAAIAELASGNGKFLHNLLRLGYKNILGVDISSEQVRLARQVTPHVEEADVLKWLSYKKEQFDFIIALDLIEHFHKDEVLQFLDLCMTALKPHGRLVLQTVNADSPFGLQHRYGDLTHELAFNTNQLSRLLGRSGFVGIEAREMGPVPWGYSLLSTMRWGVWRMIRASLQLWNLAETGSCLPVLTRIFIIKAERQ